MQRVLDGPQTFTRYHETFAQIETLYLVGGTVAGAIVGLLRRIAGNPLGAAFTGFVAFAPVALGYRVQTEGFAPWSRADTWMLIVVCLGLGCLPALIFLKQSVAKPTPRSTNPFSGD